MRFLKTINNSFILIIAAIALKAERCLTELKME